MTRSKIQALAVADAETLAVKAVTAGHWCDAFVAHPAAMHPIACTMCGEARERHTITDEQVPMSEMELDIETAYFLRCDYEERGLEVHLDRLRAAV